MPDETRPPVPLMPSTTSERAAEAASFLAAIDALLPELRSRAAEVEQRGMVPDDIIRSLTAAGVFRAAEPRQWGGLELDFAGRSLLLLTDRAALKRASNNRRTETQSFR